MSPSPATVEQDEQPIILIIDDTKENLLILGELLQAKYRVRIASSGLKGLQAAATEPRPQLILLDIMMPGKDGFAVIAELKAEPATRDIPVIFVSAMTEPEVEAQGIALGAADFLTKPIRPAILDARVSSHIELQKARQKLREHGLMP